MGTSMKYKMLLIIAILFVTGCTQTEQVSNSENQKKLISNQEDIYIGFLLDTLQDERWYNDKELFEGEVEKLGGRVKTLAANGSSEVQISQAELLLEEGVDVLVVVPQDAESSAVIVEMAHEINVKVVSYDRLIRNADLDYYISFDNEKVGELQATEILNHVSSGEFAYVGGAESDNNAVLFRAGAMKVLQPLIEKGDITLVSDGYTDGWNPAVAEENMDETLRRNGNQIDAVIAANDGTAGGVIRALAKVGLDGQVPVSGQDAELAAVQRVVNGTQTMTVYKSINMLAEQAASVAMRVAKQEEIETNHTIENGKVSVPSILLEPITVTKDNVKETVIKEGYLKEEDIYK